MKKARNFRQITKNLEFQSIFKYKIMKFRFNMYNLLYRQILFLSETPLKKLENQL